MFRFFLNTTIEDPQNIIITDKDIVKKIIKVLRLKAGDSLFLFDNVGEEYEVAIKELKDKKIFCRLSRRMEIDRELPIEIVLYQSLLKKDKLEWVCQKVTEIGIKRIIPVVTEFCVISELNQNKISRYKKIIAEATMQSGGKIPPVFEPVIKFTEAVKTLNSRDLNIICHEQEKDNNLLEILRTHGNKVINIFVGPEGGFSPFEIDLARQNSLIPVGLGKRILRSETAGIVAIGTISQIFN